MTDAENAKKPDQMKLAQKVSKIVEISSVNLNAIHAEKSTTEAFENADIGFHVESDSTRLESRIAVEIDFTVRISKEAGDEQIALIGCNHTLVYQVSGDSTTEIDDECVKAFGKINGLYNCWPYIREIIQSTLTRLGLPPFALPVLTANRILAVYESPSENDEESTE